MDATVAGALIGVGGGVVGAAIGAFSSLAVAARQRKYQREDRDVLLWADKRRDVYLRFLTEAAELEERLPSLPRTEAEPGYGPVPHSERKALMAAFDEVRLIAPREVVEPANMYAYNLCWPMNNAHAYHALALGRRPFDRDYVFGTLDLLNRTRDAIRAWERKTRTAMRESLGTGAEFDLPTPEQEDKSDSGSGTITSTGYPAPPPPDTQG